MRSEVSEASQRLEFRMQSKRSRVIPLAYGLAGVRVSFKVLKFLSFVRSVVVTLPTFGPWYQNDGLKIGVCVSSVAHHGFVCDLSHALRCSLPW